MKIFPAFFFCFLIVTSSQSFVCAQESNDNLAQTKAERIASIDFRIKTLQEKRNCILRAGSKENIKECTEVRKKALTQHKQEKEAEKNERISGKLKKLEEQEEKLRSRLNK